MLDNDYQYSVVIPWSSKIDTTMAWNELCAQGMELFGLPGDRYITQANINDMTWFFKNKNDALLMLLKFSDRIC